MDDQSSDVLVSCQNALALAREGLAEARRLGGVPASDIVDLDAVQRHRRDPEDFLLGVRFEWPRDDDPLLSVSLRKRNLRRGGSAKRIS